MNCGSIVSSWRLLRYCTVNSIVKRYVETAMCMCVSGCIWHLFVCGLPQTAWFSETASSVTVAPGVQCMTSMNLMCFSVHMLLRFYILYPSHWIKDKFERSKVTLEEEIAARDKQVRELTTVLAVRNLDLDKKEVRGGLLWYNENCHRRLTVFTVTCTYNILLM